MALFVTKLITHFLVAFGVVMGATIFQGFASVLTLQPPSNTMKSFAANIKIWAVIAAVGGTIDPFRAIETNFLEGALSDAMKQILLIISAFLGAHIGTKFMQWLSTGEWL